MPLAPVPPAEVPLAPAEGPLAPVAPAEVPLVPVAQSPNLPSMPAGCIGMAQEATLAPEKQVGQKPNLPVPAGWIGIEREVTLASANQAGHSLTLPVALEKLRKVPAEVPSCCCCWPCSCASYSRIGRRFCGQWHLRLF